MTRHTHLYKTQCVIDKKKQDIFYRDLTAVEYTFFTNIKNTAIRDDMAGKMVIYQMDPEKVPFGTRIIIGRDALSRVDRILDDKQMFEITITELRNKLKQDDFLIAIKSILICLPGQSYTDLLNLTLVDLLELVCLCEAIIGKPLFDIGSFKKGGLINTKTLPDDGKSLQEKMSALNGFIKG